MKTIMEASIPAVAAILPLVLALAACTSAPPNPAFGRVPAPLGTSGAATAADEPEIRPPEDLGEEGAVPPGTEPEASAMTAADPGMGQAGDSGSTTPEQAAGGGLPETYRIRRGDVLSISVFREPSLNQEARVDADGTINMPLVRQIPVEGMTKYEAERAIAAVFADGYLKNPAITVEIRPQGTAAAEGMVRILGEVRRPGLYPISPGGTLSLLNALTSAGGVTEIASRNRIQITRMNDQGKRDSFRANFDRIVDGLEADFELLPNDIVRVPAGWW